VRLHNDEIKRHVRPSELRELEAIVTLFERANEKDEAWPRGKKVNFPVVTRRFMMGHQEGSPIT
jgi:hypothetical protein